MRKRRFPFVPFLFVFYLHFSIYGYAHNLKRVSFGTCIDTKLLYSVVFIIGNRTDEAPGIHDHIKIISYVRNIDPLMHFRCMKLNLEAKSTNSSKKILK